MDMNFPIHNNNFPLSLGQQNWNWRSNNLSLQTMFPEPNPPRSILMNFPFHRMGENMRHSSWNVQGNRRRPDRRRTNLDEMRNYLSRITDEMNAACGNFDEARVDLQETKIRLEDVKHDVIEMKNRLQNAIRKLDRLVNNFRAPRLLNSLCMRDRCAFQRELENVRRKIEEARACIRDAEYELEEEDGSGAQGRNAGRANNMVVETVARIPSTENAEADQSVSTNNNNNNNNGEKIDGCIEGNSCCSVCMENPVNAVLYNCGHMCMCYTCSSKLLRRRGDNRRCPMCRAVIRDVIKIYKS